MFEELAEHLKAACGEIREHNIISVNIYKNSINVHLTESKFKDAPGEPVINNDYYTDYAKATKYHEGIEYTCLIKKEG